MEAKEKLYLSLVIPAYNEENIIAGSLKKILSFLAFKKYEWEVLVVDDGSYDNTSKEATKFNKEGVKVIKLVENQGKGAAIRAGVNAARGEFVLFTDADLSVAISMLDDFLAKMRQGAEVAIGSRRVAGSKIVKHQNLIRESLGRVYTFLSRVVTSVNVSDFTCGFKGFSEKAAKTIFSKTVIDRWAYDSEILFLARKYGYRIVEIPVAWINRKASRVSLGRDLITSFRDLFRIRINDYLGKYD